MGGQESILYAEPITEPKENESAIYRSPMTAKSELISFKDATVRTMKDSLLRI